MSYRYEYEESHRVAELGVGFYALIMAALRQADTFNAEKLRAAWPDVCDEMQARYNAPGGLLPGEEAAS